MKKFIAIISIVIFIALLIASNLLLNKQTSNSNNSGENLVSNKDIQNTDNLENIPEETTTQELKDNPEPVTIEESENESNVKTIDLLTFSKYVLESDKKVLVDFYADWCMPCKNLAPTLEKVARRK